MPYNNEHAARLKSPEMQHLRVRRTSGSGDGNVQGVKVPSSIDVIWYIIKTKDGESPIAQTLRFPVKDWTPEAAKEWLTKNNIKYMSFEAAEKPKKGQFDFTCEVNNDVADIFIYGGIGDTVNGDDIAKEIYNLNQIGVTTINERINSNGGFITNGLSIVSANLNSKAEINTYNDGICASMAGIILLTGHKIFMADYAQLMLHEPSMMGNTIDTTKDEKVKRALISLRDSLSSIMQTRTKKTKEECDSIMEAETWYNAKQAKKEGFIDEIVSYAKKPKLKNEMSTDEILLAVAATYNNNSKTKKMENIFKELGLSTESTEQDAINEIKSIKASVTDGKELKTVKAENSKLLEEKTNVIAEVEKIKGEKTEVETKVSAKDKEIESLNDKLLETVIDQAIMLGTFVEKDREGLKAQFKGNVDGLKFVIRNSTSKAANIIAQLNVVPNGTDVTAEWGFAEWSKNDPKGLQEIRKNDLKKYNALGKKTYGANWTDEV
jgi:ATP-dependent protease ClpP protease subunit